MRNSLSRRLDALDARYSAPNYAGAADAFRAKFIALVERMEGHEAGPNDSQIVQIAAQCWTDPEGAAARLKAAAQAAIQHRRR